MPIKDPKEVFVMLLSDVRRGADHSTKLFRELSDFAQDEEIKEALLARVFIAEDINKKLDECFRIIGAQPMKLEGKLKEVFAEDLRREVAEIQSPEARRLYVLAKAIHLLHFRIGEYAVDTRLALRAIEFEIVHDQIAGPSILNEDERIRRKEPRDPKHVGVGVAGAVYQAGSGLCGFRHAILSETCLKRPESLSSVTKSSRRRREMKTLRTFQGSCATSASMFERFQSFQTNSI